MPCVLENKSEIFANKQAGATAVEFALMAPVFMMLVAGIVEFSLIMFASTVLESATNITARIGSTGYDPTGITRQQEIINTINAQAGGLLNTSLITVNSEVYSNFNDIGQPEPCISPPTPPCPGTPGVNFTDINGNGVWDSDMGAAGLGGAGDVVVYTVTYPWTVNTPLIAIYTGSTYTISAKAVVRNEPF